MKIRTKLFAAVLACIIPAWVGIGAITVVGRTSDREKTEDLMQEYTHGMARSLELFFADARHAAASLASMQTVSLSTIEAGSGLNWAQARPFFMRLLSVYPAVNQMALVEQDGSFYKTDSPGNPWQGGRMTENDSEPNSRPLSVAGLDFYRVQILDNPHALFYVVLSEPFIPPDRTEKAFVTSAPIISGMNVIGIVCVTQTLGELSSVYAEISSELDDKFGNSAHLFLITEGGQLVSELRYNEEVSAYRDTLADRADAIVYLDALESDYVDALNAAVASGGVVTAPMHGETHYLSASKIEGTPFIACLATLQSDMLSASNTMFLAATILFLILAVVMAVIMFAITKTMLSSITTIDGTMQDISKDWDLTARIDVTGKDEIAEIGESINGFVSSLNEMVKEVSESSKELTETGKALTENASEISDSVSDINKDIDDLHFTVEEQSASVTETSATVTQITHNIESLTGQIESQSAAVAESSASVQEMVSNISSISENLSKAQGSFDALKVSASDGKESIHSVQDLVNNLASQSDSLLEANSVINNIASQTNLLAMNAAIEAAHAGEAGRGFAVVAEEIRKLAESSAKQSKTIAAGLKDAVNAIKNIADATAVADGAFDTVVERIASVTSLVAEINLAMQEQSEGSQQVLEALQDIENVTVQIRDGAVEMNSGTETILKEITRLSSVSQAVQERSASIAKAAEAINGAVDKIVESSGSNKDAIDVLVGVTGRFVL